MNQNGGMIIQNNITINMNGGGGAYPYDQRQYMSAQPVTVKPKQGFKAILSGNQQDESGYEQSPIVELADLNEEVVFGEATPSFPENLGKQYISQKYRQDNLLVEEELKVSPKKLIKSNKDHILMNGVTHARPVKDNSK